LDREVVAMRRPDAPIECDEARDGEGFAKRVDSLPNKVELMPLEAFGDKARRVGSRWRHEMNAVAGGANRARERQPEVVKIPVGIGEEQRCGLQGTGHGAPCQIAMASGFDSTIAKVSAAARLSRR